VSAAFERRDVAVAVDLHLVGKADDALLEVGDH
jgi:hypothetical protein